MIEVVEIARRQLKITAEPERASMKNRIWDGGTWVCDSGLIKQRLNWSPRYSLDEGFARMVEWFRTNPAATEVY